MLNLDQVETALCVWEAMLDQSSRSINLTNAFDAVGTGEMRCAVAGITAWFDQVYDTISEDVRGDYCFDWVFVPAALHQITWDGSTPTMPYPLVAAEAVEKRLPEYG